MIEAGGRLPNDEVMALAAKAGFSGIGEGVNQILAFVFYLVAARYLSLADFGLFGLTMTIVGIAAILAVFGFDATTLRFVAAYQGQGRATETIRLLRFSRVFVVVTSAGLGILLFLNATYVATTIFHKPELTLALRLASCLVPLYALQMLSMSILQGFHRIVERVWLERILGPGIRLAAMIIAGAIGLGLRGAVGATALGFGCSMLWAFSLSRSLEQPHGNTDNAGPYPIAGWFGFAVPMLMDALAYIPLVGSLDMLLLGYFRSSTEVGEYTAALRLAPVVALPLIALNRVFAPRISEFYARGELRQLDLLFKGATKWVIVTSLPILIVMIVYREELLMVFGQKYVGAAACLMFLALGRGIDAMTGPVGYMLSMTGRAWISLSNSLGLLIGSAILGIVLIPKYGIVGMAIAQGIAVASVNGFRLLEVYTILHLHPYEASTWRSLAAGAAALAFALILQPRIEMIRSGGGALAVGSLAICTSYVGLRLLLGLGISDSSLMESVTDRLSRRHES